MVPEKSIPVVAVDALEIVFAHRNKAYGAYQLRRAYPGYLARALGIGFLLILTGLVLPALLSAVSGAFPAFAEKESEITLGPPPELEKREVPLPATPKTFIPPPLAQERFVPPVVMRDNEARDEVPPVVDNLVNTKDKIGAIDQEGKAEGPPEDIRNSDFGGVIEHPAPPAEDKVYEFMDVNKMPGFPGGEKELFAFLANNIKYPVMARESGIQGMVALSFVVDKNGNITDVTALKEVGGGCTKEAIRVVQMMPRWNPGEANGNPVKVRFVLPIRFKLD